MANQWNASFKEFLRLLPPQYPMGQALLGVFWPIARSLGLTYSWLILRICHQCEGVWLTGPPLSHIIRALVRQVFVWVAEVIQDYLIDGLSSSQHPCRSSDWRGSGAPGSASSPPWFPRHSSGLGSGCVWYYSSLQVNETELQYQARPLPGVWRCAPAGASHSLQSIDRSGIGSPLILYWSSSPGKAL